VPGRVQQGGGDAGAVAGLAVNPERPARQLAQAAGQFVERHVYGARDVAAGPFGRAADVQDGEVLAVPGGG